MTSRSRTVTTLYSIASFLRKVFQKYKAKEDFQKKKALGELWKNINVFETFQGKRPLKSSLNARFRTCLLFFYSMVQRDSGLKYQPNPCSCTEGLRNNHQVHSLLQTEQFKWTWVFSFCKKLWKIYWNVIFNIWFPRQNRV